MSQERHTFRSAWWACLQAFKRLQLLRLLHVVSSVSGSVAGEFGTMIVQVCKCQTSHEAFELVTMPGVSLPAVLTASQLVWTMVCISSALLVLARDTLKVRRMHTSRAPMIHWYMCMVGRSIESLKSTVKPSTGSKTSPAVVWTWTWQSHGWTKAGTWASFIGRLGH